MIAFLSSEQTLSTKRNERKRSQNSFRREKALVAFHHVATTMQKKTRRESGLNKNESFRRITKSVCSTDHMLSVTHALFVSRIHSQLSPDANHLFQSSSLSCAVLFRIHIASNARHVFISTSSQILHDCFCLWEHCTHTHAGEINRLQN